MRLPGLKIFALTFFGFSGCGSTPQQGGAGAEAGNAITVEAISKDGRPVAGARVEIRPAGSDALDPTQVGVTGDDGRVRLEVGVDRKWSVLVRREGMAFWKIVDAGQSAMDTLRPVSRLSGLLQGCKSTIISIPGMGKRTPCQENEYFQLDSLPSGLIPVRFSDSVPDPSLQEEPSQVVAQRAAAAMGLRVREIQVQIQPGRDVSLILDSNWDQSAARAVPTDTLAVWGKEAMPASLPKGQWGDTGVFSLAIRVQRIDTVDRLTVLSWRSADSNGLTIRWQGWDTLVVEVGGQTFVASDSWLDLDRSQSIGVLWDGTRLQVKVGSWSRVWEDAPGLANRAGWLEPKLGTPEACRIQWVASVRGGTEDTWLSTIEKGGRNDTPSSGAGSGGTVGGFGIESSLLR